MYGDPSKVAWILTFLPMDWLGETGCGLGWVERAEYQSPVFGGGLH